MPVSEAKWDRILVSSLSQLAMTVEEESAAQEIADGVATYIRSIHQGDPQLGASVFMTGEQTSFIHPRGH
jgi:hypothetical protein